MLRLVLAAVLALGIGQAVAQVQRVVPQSRPDTIFSFAPVVKRVTPAVVNVYASRTVKTARQSAVRRSVLSAVLRQRAERRERRNRSARASSSTVRASS